MGDCSCLRHCSPRPHCQDFTAKFTSTSNVKIFRVTVSAYPFDDDTKGKPAILIRYPVIEDYDYAYCYCCYGHCYYQCDAILCPIWGRIEEELEDLDEGMRKYNNLEFVLRESKRVGSSDEGWHVHEEARLSRTPPCTGRNYSGHSVASLRTDQQQQQQQQQRNGLQQHYSCMVS